VGTVDPRTAIRVAVRSQRGDARLQTAGVTALTICAAKTRSTPLQSIPDSFNAVRESDKTATWIWSCKEAFGGNCRENPIRSTPGAPPAPVAPGEKQYPVDDAPAAPALLGESASARTFNFS